MIMSFSKKKNPSSGREISDNFPAEIKLSSLKLIKLLLHTNNLREFTQQTMKLPALDSQFPELKTSRSRSQVEALGALLSLFCCLN